MDINTQQPANAEAPHSLASSVELDLTKGTWRDRLPILKAANNIPEASDEEKRKLAGDLRQHGSKVPVVLVRVAGGSLQLLDGRHRLDLLEGIGIKVVNDDGAV